MENRQPDNRQTADPLNDHASPVSSVDRLPEQQAAGKPEHVSMEEHLERLAVLNLSSSYASRSRMSPSIIRLLSAATGVAVLLLLYLCFKLFL